MSRRCCDTFFVTSCFFVARQGLEQWMCLSVVRRFDCQCNFLILLWSSCVISLAIEVGVDVGLRGRWQDDQSHGTHYVSALTPNSNLRKHVWVQWIRKCLREVSHFLKPRTYEQSDEAIWFSPFFLFVSNLRGSCRRCSIRCCISSFRCAASLEWRFSILDWLFDIGLKSDAW